MCEKIIFIKAHTYYYLRNVYLLFPIAIVHYGKLNDLTLTPFLFFVLSAASV